MIENENFTYIFNSEGSNIAYINKADNKNYLNTDSKEKAFCEYNNRRYYVDNIEYDGKLLTYIFSEINVKAKINVTKVLGGIILKIDSIIGDVDKITFVNIPLIGDDNNIFHSTILAISANTQVAELPVIQTDLKATAYSAFGIEGASVFLSSGEYSYLKRSSIPIFKNTYNLSSRGGFFAKSSDNRSYIMNFGDINVDNVDEWIRKIKEVGFSQIDFHGGNEDFFKHGDFVLNNRKWKNGWKDFNLINQKLKKAGITSILHTYSYFIDKKSNLVSPVPHRDLAYSAKFILNSALDKDQLQVNLRNLDDNILPSISNNDNYIRIDNEIIQFTSISKNTNGYSLNGVKRGALNTKVQKHVKNSEVFNLRQNYNLFLPIPSSKLFNDIAKRTAQIINEAGFDGIYFDAFDNLAGDDGFWYYGNIFLNEFQKSLNKDITIEMSSMEHHFWKYRSRYQAWDYPVRGFQRFVDIHLAYLKNKNFEKGIYPAHNYYIDKYGSQSYSDIMLPLHLGWWSYNFYNPPQSEPTFIEDIEYLIAKMIGNDASLSLIDFAKVQSDKAKEFNSIIKEGEQIRKLGQISESIKAKLRETNNNFLFVKNGINSWKIKNTTTLNFKSDKNNRIFNFENFYFDQPMRFRIMALNNIEDYNNGDNLPDFLNSKVSSAHGVKGSITNDKSKYLGQKVINIKAHSNGDVEQEGSWILFEKEIDINLQDKKALGLWVYGDNKGEILNIRYESPVHLSYGAKGDHYIKIDFKGWKYFELFEIESTKFNNYIWTSGNVNISPNDSYKSIINFNKISKIQIWCNNIPPNQNINIKITSPKALKDLKNNINNIKFKLNNKEFTIPLDIGEGMYLEVLQNNIGKIFDKNGNLYKTINIQDIPQIRKGNNKLEFISDKNLTDNRFQFFIRMEGNMIN